MEKWVVLNSHAAGRDKVARLIQYTSRAIWDSLETADSTPALADKFKTLEYILSSFRKLLRFGKCLDMFYASLRTIHHPDLAVRVTLTIGKLSQSLFLLADHFMWLSRTGLFQSIDVKKWTKFANKYWLLSITMNLCRDVYEIFRVLDLHKASVKSGISRCSPVSCSINSPRDLSRLTLQSFVMMQGHRDVVVDTVKNVCDFFIPLTALGYVNLTPRTIGFLGAISSAAGLLALWDPAAKLTPA